MPGTESGGWTALKKPDYVAARIGAFAAGQEGVLAAANRFAFIWRQNLEGSRTGRWYNVKFRTLWRGRVPYVAPVGGTIDRQASAPGEPPAKQSGRLQEAVKVKQVVKFDRQQYRSRAIVSNNLPYAAFLEYGVGPTRPFKHPAKQTNRRVKQFGAFGGPHERRRADEGYGSRNRPFTIEPRPHLRKTIREGMVHVNQDLLITIQGRLVPPHVQNFDIRKIRRLLLRLSAKLGVFQLFGVNSKFLFLIRQRAIKLERGLGDYDAFVNGDIAGRVRRKIIGRNLGLQIGRIAGTTRADPRFIRSFKRQARVTLGQLGAGVIK